MINSITYLFNYEYHDRRATIMRFIAALWYLDIVSDWYADHIHIVDRLILIFTGDVGVV